MKNTYIIPATEVVEVSVNTMLCASGGSSRIGGGTLTGGDSGMSARGAW